MAIALKRTKKKPTKKKKPATAVAGTPQ